MPRWTGLRARPTLVASTEGRAVRVQTDRFLGVIAAVALGIVVVGCGGTGDDRAGGKRSPKAVTLTLANPLPSPDELRPFVDEVERISRGKVEIRFRNEWLSWPWRRTEAALIRDVAAGKADLGWVGSRAWDDVGVTSFDPLHAPLVVDSYPLQAAVLESGVVDGMLEDVDPLGLVGLGVLPGPLRKVLGVDRPLVRPSDFAGLRVGLNRSQVGSDTLRALGAVPVTVPGGVHLEGQLDGLEQQVASIDGNTYDDAARYLTANVNLWPRWVVVFMNAEAFAALDGRSRMRCAMPCRRRRRSCSPLRRRRRKHRRRRSAAGGSSSRSPRRRTSPCSGRRLLPSSPGSRETRRAAQSWRGSSRCERASPSRPTRSRRAPS